MILSNTQWLLDCHRVQMDYDIITMPRQIIAPYRILEGSKFMISAPYRILEGSGFMISSPFWILEGSRFMDSIYGYCTLLDIGR